MIYKVNMADGSTVMVDNPATPRSAGARIDRGALREDGDLRANSFNGTLMELCQNGAASSST